MRRTAAAVAAGVVVQAALLAAVSGMPPHHPATATTAFRVVSVGAVGGFVAAFLADATPYRASVAAGAAVGVAVGAAFWYAVLYGETVGVLHHLHYALATTVWLLDVAARWPRLVVGGVAVAVAAAFVAGSLLGGVAAERRR
ncbi:hypothetical protein [Halobacterium yunchengense]|uniref:hypothetical protein n=1 Tax=Halobacterium yunchengense TaxID=3108497 RepID=UPI0030084289